MKRRLMRFIIQNKVPMIIGGVATAMAVKYTYEMRGYLAIGGEWLILPFTVFIFTQGKEFIHEAYPLLIEPLLALHRQRVRNKRRRVR